MKLNLFKGLFDVITRFLLKKRPIRGSALQLSDFERLCYEIRPCDVLLVTGRSRVSEVIRIITQSHWSHGALYIGRLHDIESEEHRQMITEHYQCSPSEQLLIESEMGRGTAIVPLKYYQREHIRICRPHGLLRKDAQRIINYAVEHLGREYDMRQILDLARFLFPWNLFPRRWRSSLFAHNAGKPTRDVCSTLIAEAFSSVDFPILPLVRTHEDKKIEFVRRNPRLFTPSDFDFSPYFEIIKYPLIQVHGAGLYRHLPWKKEEVYNEVSDTQTITQKDPSSKKLEESQVTILPKGKPQKQEAKEKQQKTKVIENNDVKTAK